MLDIRPTQIGNGIQIVDSNGKEHVDQTNHPNDPPVRISYFPNNSQTGTVFSAAVIGGNEHDCVYGYKIVGLNCFRSPCWQDTSPGVLDLHAVTWINENEFSIVNGGSMTFDLGTNTWNVTLGTSAQYGDSGNTKTTTVF